MNRGEKLTALMEEKGFTARSLSRETGVAYTTIRSMIERDLVNASIDNTLKICKALGIRVEDIMEEEKPSYYSAAMVAETSTPYKIHNERVYPFYNVSVAAGVPTSVESITSRNAQELTLPDTIMGKYAGSEDVFLMRVNGDSMNEVIPHDSIIVVKKINLDALCDNDIVVFSNDHNYSVKRYYNDVDNKRLIFSAESTDRRFADHIVPYSETENLIIHGKVVLYIVST